MAAEPPALLAMVQKDESEYDPLSPPVVNVVNWRSVRPGRISWKQSQVESWKGFGGVKHVVISRGIKHQKYHKI